MKEKTFENIKKGNYGGSFVRSEYVIIDDNFWGNIWDNINSGIILKPDVPMVDFDNEMIIVVYQGGFNTGGYGIEIKKIIENKDQLEVLVEETSPDRGMMVTQAFSQPYHMVKTEKFEKEIKFKRI